MQVQALRQLLQAQQLDHLLLPASLLEHLCLQWLQLLQQLLLMARQQVVSAGEH
jgi:hypothetical protein